MQIRAKKQGVRLGSREIGATRLGRIGDDGVGAAVWQNPGQPAAMVEGSDNLRGATLRHEKYSESFP
jgi:hypothetical protein